MAEQNDSKDYVKKELMYAVAFITLVVGFLGGVVFSSFKGGATSSPVTFSQPNQQASSSPGQPQGLTPEQANTILSLESEVAKNPDNVEAWTNLGHIYFDTHKYAKAIRAYEKSLELHPDRPDVITDLAVMYRRSKNPAKAIELFDKAMKIDPKHEQSRFNKGIVLMYDMNDKQGAISAWEGLLAVNPFASGPGGQSIREMVDNLKE
ncbi:MAG: tetratricopeptide repeat protein [Proteobacteria bacterium]|nr:tetratricopeptide repeat protein [Pseudomonadota bacterium]